MGFFELFCLCFFLGGGVGYDVVSQHPFLAFFLACSVPSPSQGAARCAFNPGGHPKKKKAEKGILAIFHHLPPSSGWEMQQVWGFPCVSGGERPRAVQIKTFFGFLTVFSGSSIKSRVPQGSSGAAFCPKIAFSPLFLPLYSSVRLGGYANICK